MFSRDPKHYRPTPRTTSEAFGPYHEFLRDQKRLRNLEFLSNISPILGVLIVGIVYGLLFGWRG